MHLEAMGVLVEALVTEQLLEETNSKEIAEEELAMEIMEQGE